MMVQLSSSATQDAPLKCPAAVPVLVKHRFPKRYRHPTLDAQLTRQRLASEARALVRCLKAGVRVPALRLVDVRHGCLGIEWVEGWTVREILGGGQEDDSVAENSDPVPEQLAGNSAFSEGPSGGTLPALQSRALSSFR